MTRFGGGLALIGLLALLALHVSPALAQTACPAGSVCAGPELSPFRYQVSDGGPAFSADTEAAAIAAYQASASAGMCTFTLTDNRPGWQLAPAGHGHAASGDYSTALFAGTAQYWVLDWTLSQEVQQTTIPLRVDKTYWPTGCNISRTHGVYVNRLRSVACPSGYNPNLTPAPANAFCARGVFTRDPPKNLGESCPEAHVGSAPKFGNPMNAANGNKLQVETDYRGAGNSPLQFVRYYNSQLTSYYAIGSTTTGIASTLGPSWRSSYERVVRFADSTVFPTAYVYRPDGQTLAFRLQSGQFVPDGDIQDKLVRLLDGSGNPTGWTYTVAKNEAIETYDVTGRLLSIAERGGITDAVLCQWTTGQGQRQLRSRVELRLRRHGSALDADRSEQSDVYVCLQRAEQRQQRDVPGYARAHLSLQRGSIYGEPEPAVCAHRHHR
jgi:hypothetical protein